MEVLSFFSFYSARRFFINDEVLGHYYFINIIGPYHILLVYFLVA